MRTWLEKSQWLRCWYQENDLLLLVVEGDGEVLPFLCVDGNRVEGPAVAVEELEVVLVRGGLADDLADLELDLVVGVVGGLVPGVLSDTVNINSLLEKQILDSPGTHESSSMDAEDPA